MINFQVAHGWIYQYEDVDSFLGSSAKPIGRAIQEAIASKDYSDIEILIDRIMRIARTSTKFLEIAEINLLCARAYYAMGKMEKTLKPLDEAGKLYKSDPHKHAVVLWMKGCVLWELGGRQAEALQSWQSSLDVFERMRRQYLLKKQAPQWYEQQCEKMRASIIEVNPIQVTNPRIHQSLYIAVNQIIPLDAKMPVSPKKVQANHFRIDNNSYQLINLGETTEISLADAPGLFALWVEDDTMDQVGIMKGDYVLLRWQDTADNNSIVAVVIDNIDTHAKLKSYIQEPGKIILRPQSSNPDHKSNEFSVKKKKFSIKGVVLGVFKPI